MSVFDVVARWYDLLPIPTHPEAVALHVGEVEGTVVDLGGGTGRWLDRIAPNATRRVVVDSSRAMLEAGVRAGRDHARVQASAHRLPLAEGAAEAVIVTEAFHHFAPHEEAVLADVARVLAPGGVLVVEEVDPARPLGRTVEVFEKVLRMGSRFRRPQALRDLVAVHFPAPAVVPTGAFTYLVAARKDV